MGAAGRARLLGRAVLLYLRSAGGLCAVKVAGVAAGGLGPVLLAWLTKQLIDRLAAGHGSVVGPALALGLVGAAVALTQHVVAYTDNELSRRVSRVAQAQLFEAVNRPVGIRHLEEPGYLDRLRLATLSATGGVSRLTNSLFATVQTLVTVVGFLVTLVAVSPVTTVLVLVSTVPLVLAQARLARLRAANQLATAPHQRRHLAFQMLMTDIRAAQELRLYRLGAVLQTRMLDELRTAHAGDRRVDGAVLRTDLSRSCVTGLVSVVALVVVTTRIAAGHGTVGDLSLLVGALNGAQNALATTARSIASIDQNLVGFGHHQSIVRPAPPAPTASVPPAPGSGEAAEDGRGVRAAAAAPGPLRDRIELHDVWFRYDPDGAWALRGVSLVVEAGSSVALVGRNGAGKSTLVKLLCRLYEPTRGRITWDGRDIADLDPAELRARIGVVFQDFMQYELTARENIAVGQVRMITEARAEDDERIVRAARLAGAHHTLTALPRGYDTLLTRIFRVPNPSAAPGRSRPGARHAGARHPDARRTDARRAGPPPERTAPDSAGTTLSGGQWQRVALARAVLHEDADLLILDEPSSGLDAEAEHDVHARLTRMRHGRTGLLISHRLSTVRDADTIVVLRDGRVIERGTHDHLMATGGDYADLFRTQAGGYQLDRPRG